MLDLSKIKDVYRGLSAREKFMALVAVLVLLSLGGYSLVEPVGVLMQKSSQELKKARDSLGLLPTQIEKYFILNSRQKEIEKRYQKVSFPDGEVLSYLEGVIKEQGGVEKNTDYKINEQPQREFGGQYIQEAFRIELYLLSEESLAKILSELVRGPRPMVLSRLNVKSTPNKSRLIVNLEVSSFRRSIESEKL